MDELLKIWKKELKELKKQRQDYLNIPLREYELRREEIRKEFAVVCGKGAQLQKCIEQLEQFINESK